MSDGTYRGRWIDEVFRTPMVSAEVKVFLLFLAYKHMSTDGRVSESRACLAEGLGCYERRINERFEAAIKGGLMERVSRGQKHRTAVYRAAIPAEMPNSQGAGNPPAEAPQWAGNPPAEPDSQGAKNPPAENAQGAGDPPAEAISGSGQPAPHIHTHLPESDQRDGGVVVALFDEKTTQQKTHTPARKRASESVSDESAFAAFWNAYPRKVAKGAARKAWARAIKDGADPADVVLGARRYATDPRRNDSDIRYTAHPATWLNSERWADEDAPPPVAGRALVPADRRQQATNDMFDRAMARAEAREGNT